MNKDMAASTTPINGIAANWFHGEGAIARCGYCGRYTLDRNALGDRQPTCTCGKQHGWSGSFVKPGPDAIWHGVPPVVATQAAERVAATPPQQVTNPTTLPGTPQKETS